MYTGNVYLAGESTKEIHNNKKTLIETAKEVGLEVNVNKIKNIVSSQNCTNTTKKIVSNSRFEILLLLFVCHVETEKLK